MTQRINRIFLDQPLEVDSVIEMPAEAVRHLSTVLKVKVDDPVILFNNSQYEYQASIIEVAKRQVKVQIYAKHLQNVESSLTLNLIQAVARGDKMDWIIQKSVELGVTSITPLFTERTGVKLSQERLDKKMEHWHKVIISACEQCGRNQLPILKAPLTFNELCNDEKTLENAIQLYPHVGTSLSKLPALDRYTLIIGPEGGLSAAEVEMLKAKQVKSVRMGPRILRTETAGLAAISILQATFGDLA